MMSMFQAVLLFVFPALMIAAALRDLTSYTIPNWMPGVLILGFFGAALTLGLAPQTIGLHAGVGAIALVLGMVMFALNWIGGGDAKLFAAGGLWLGWPASIDYVLITCVVGGGLALALLGLRSMWVRRYAEHGPAWFGRLATPGESVPYGVAIAVGGLVAFPTSSVMQAFLALS